MLKKFLQILKGSAPAQDFDGSYLDYLLAKARPGARARMQACPQHDPLLIVVTELLRQLAPDAWAEPKDAPLSDAQSPPLISDTLTGDGADRPMLAVKEDEAPSDETLDEVPGKEIGEKSGEKSGEGAPQLAAETHETAPAALIAPTDSGDSGQLPAADISVDDLEIAAEPPEGVHLSDPSILRAGRIFLGLLIENDRLPIPMQLTAAEILLSRDLLLGYFVKNEHFESHAQELLGLVEQKFNEAAFSQARILLRLFQTDRATRINNDRNLYYEEMILRMGVRRRNKIRASQLDELSEVIADAWAGSEGAQEPHAQLDAQLRAASAWLDTHLHITCHLFTRDAAEMTAWREYAALSRRDGAEAIFLRYLPPRRWRPISTGAESPSQLLLAHISASTVKQFMIRQVKSAYFILRAVGDTGLEPFLDSFFDWTERRFDLDFVRLMPRVYRETMGDKKLVEQVFELIFNRYLKKDAAQNLAKFDDKAILKAAQEVTEALSSYDYNKIPAGHYDFGGLILDRLFEVEYPDPEFAFKLHRLT